MAAELGARKSYSFAARRTLAQPQDLGHRFNVVAINSLIACMDLLSIARLLEAMLPT